MEVHMVNACWCQVCRLAREEAKAAPSEFAKGVEAANSVTGGQGFDMGRSAGSKTGFYKIFGSEPRLKDGLDDPAAQDAIDDWRLVNPRKRQPIASGVLAYFPDAIREVAMVSEAGNRQHGTVGWDKSKSADELNSLCRHLLDHTQGELRDTDGMLHLAKVAWRALAALQRLLEA